jgi:hypothetical protein
MIMMPIQVRRAAPPRKQSAQAASSSLSADQKSVPWSVGWFARTASRQKQAGHDTTAAVSEAQQNLAKGLARTLGADLEPLGLNADVARRQFPDPRESRKDIGVAALLCEPCDSGSESEGRQHRAGRSKYARVGDSHRGVKGMKKRRPMRMKDGAIWMANGTRNDASDSMRRVPYVIKLVQRSPSQHKSRARGKTTARAGLTTSRRCRRR